MLVESAPPMPHNPIMDTTEPRSGPLVGEPQHAVPEDLRARLHPARWIVHEWAEYWLQADHAVVASVRVGATEIPATPFGSGNFRLRFENQLGLATISLREANGRVVEQHHLEVIAPKLATVEASLEFLEATLVALFQQIATTPFVLDSPTGRQVQDVRSHRHPLFDFHFFRQHSESIHRAIQAIVAQPHRRLDVQEMLVLPHQVRQVDRQAMLHVLQASRPMAGRPASASPLHRLRPERVLQQIPTETWDTPENRFVRDVAREMLMAIEVIEREPWWTGLPVNAQRPVRASREHLMLLVTDHRFASLGRLTVPPMQSRVLQRKDGYRELAALWPRFQRAQEPLFAAIESAIALRQIDQLYELWVLFDLIEQIAAMTGEQAQLTAQLDSLGAPTNNYAATFGDHGTLHYNRTKRTYSGLPLRPDYLWVPTCGRRVALDAKFRLRHQWIQAVTESGETEWNPTGEAKATTDDLTKMHAYRDAIPNVRAAVVLFPGTISMFRTTTSAKIPDLTLAELLANEDLHGIGAIAQTPVSIVQP